MIKQDFVSDNDILNKIIEVDLKEVYFQGYLLINY